MIDDEDPTMIFPHRRLAGTILYLDREGHEWGRERFSDTLHAHGRVRRAECEMDSARLFREASWSLDSKWRPREEFVRNIRDGMTIGSCWYRVDGRDVECEGVTADDGRISRRLRASGDIVFLGTPPLSGDCITATARGTDAPGEERAIQCAANSVAYLGDEGLSVLLIEPLVTYVGPQTG